MSRKGYVGLKEEEVRIYFVLAILFKNLYDIYVLLLFEKIKKGRLEPGVEPDRAILWKKARKQKNGEEIEDVDEELAVICDKIVS